MRRYASNPKFDRENNKLEFDTKSESFDMQIYNNQDNDVTKNGKDMDMDYESKFREEDEVSIKERLEYLKAEEDFKLGKSNEYNEPISKEDYQEIIKPNNDKY